MYVFNFEAVSMIILSFNNIPVFKASIPKSANKVSNWFNKVFFSTGWTYVTSILFCAVIHVITEHPCTLSAAICGYKALGCDLLDSIQKAKLFVEKSLENSYKIGSGPGPLGHH